MLRKLLLLTALLLALPCNAETLTGRVVAIADGDTLTLLADSTEHRVRLAEIDTPERAQDWGTRARTALADRVFQQNVTIDVTDVDRYGRLVGHVWLGDRDINREMVRAGHAWVYRSYMENASLLDDEQVARNAEAGLWSQPGPIAPWEFRRGARVASVASPIVTLTDSEFVCGAKRTCGEMTSCAEARFHLETCGLSRLDGDNDGTPCESICR